jgi:XTP/dITP diphosphohydrolase
VPGELASLDVDLAVPSGAQLVVGSADLPGAHFIDLVATMDRLRVQCPWDAKQTHVSLAPHLLEESYEAVEALESGDQRALREELGDVLMQPVFHARIAAERDDSTGYDRRRRGRDHSQADTAASARVRRRNGFGGR